MLSFLESFVTPAIVASLFALFFNARAEKRRDVRKALNDAFEEARNLVKQAVETSSEYFSKNYEERTPSMEAKLWLAERELRLSLSALSERSDSQLDAELQKLTLDFDQLVGDLTGSNFQQMDATADLAHVRKIAGVGADLRNSLARVHFAELQTALSADPIDKIMKFLELGRYYVPLMKRLDSN